MTSTTPEKLTVTEHVDRLTGYDELAIEKRFGADIDSLRATMQLRALTFVDETRRGTEAQAAYKTAMELSLKALGDRFADEQDEPLPDSPITEQGKDASTTV